MSRTLVEVVAEMDAADGGVPAPDLTPRVARFGPAIRNARPDGTNSPESVVVSARLSPAELAILDARRLPGERRTDAIRRLILTR